MGTPSIYLVNPRASAPSPYSAEVFIRYGQGPAVWTGDLAVTTVAALLAPSLHVQICEEAVTPADLGTAADFVGITGTIGQRHRMRELGAEYRRRGKVVLMGGPYASLSPEDCRAHCDILVRGEMEEIAPQIAADLVAGDWRDEYIGTRPNLLESPLPAWDRYPCDRTIGAAIQTSRGCPFECEFCDVIPYLGRKQRRKSPAQVIAELDCLYALGFTNIFLCDDNFTVHRAPVKELLQALCAWNERRPQAVRFATQASIDAARDPELLHLCSRAGLASVFVGIESYNPDSLREALKRQNLGVDLSAECSKFLDHGIAVTAGMIVGFDADPRDVFEQQYAFAMSAPIALFSLFPLNAAPATPLFERMNSAGRIVDSWSISKPHAWSSNIQSRRFTSEEFQHGMNWLANRLYAPRSFGERLVRVLGRIAVHGCAFESRAKKARPVETELLRLIRVIPRLGPQEEAMWNAVWAVVARRPSVAYLAVTSLAAYLQYRCVFESSGVWDPRLATVASPWQTEPQGQH